MVAVLMVAPARVQTALGRALRAEGFEVTLAPTGRQALDLIGRRSFGLVLLDLALPDISGTELLRQMKQHPRTRDVPIVVVTQVDTEIDRVVAFELGAVDYVTEPYSQRELILRLRVAVSVKAPPAGPPSNARSPEDGNGGLAINFDARCVVMRGVEISLSPREFDLFCKLGERAGAVHSRTHLRDAVWPERDVSLRTVDAAVKRLRRKLGAEGRAIETVRGLGYRLRE